jgi:hypothetical protein
MITTVWVRQRVGSMSFTVATDFLHSQIHDFRNPQIAIESIDKHGRGLDENGSTRDQKWQSATSSAIRKSSQKNRSYSPPTFYISQLSAPPRFTSLSFLHPHVLDTFLGSSIFLQH